MLRRISTGSIIISIALLMLISVTAFAQSGSGVRTFDFNSSSGEMLKGIILLDFAGGGQTSGATIWAGNQTDEPADGTTQTVSYTLSDGTQLRGIILLDFNGSGGGVQTSGATIWAQRGATVASSSDGTTDPKTIIFTDYNGTPKGVMVGDAKGVMVGDNKGRGGASLRGIILLDGHVAEVAGGAARQTSELSIVGSDGTQLRGIILLDFNGGGGGVQTSGATIWAQHGATEAGTTDGAAGGQVIMVTDEGGSFLGLLYTGDGPMPFKGYIYGNR